jgi:flagellar hook assembly protein FlgD
MLRPGRPALLSESRAARRPARRAPAAPRRALASALGAVLLAIALPLAVQAASPTITPTITNVRTLPTSFSPNADGIKDRTRLSWTLSDAAGRIEIEVERPDQPGSLFRRINLGPRPAGRDSIEWDGKDSLGAQLPDTIYALRVSQFTAVADTLLASAIASARVDTRAPSLPVFDTLADTAITNATFALGGVASGADSVILFRSGVPLDTTNVANNPPEFQFGLILLSGDNIFAAQAYDRAGNHSSLTTGLVVTYVNTADILAARVTPARFSPNGDGLVDSTRLSFRLDAPTTRLLIEIRPSLATSITVADTLPIVRLYDAPAPADTLGFVWDGRDSTGTLRADGGYYFYVQPESIAAGGGPVAGLARHLFTMLDNTPPSTPVVNPLPATTSRNSIPISGSSAGADTVYIYRNGTLMSRVTPGSFTLQVALVLGNNDFTFQGVDVAENRSAVAGPYRVLYEEPLGFHAPERFVRNDAFDVNLNAQARSATIELFTIDGRKVRTLTSTASTARYELVWNLKDDSGVDVGSGPYVARLRVSFADGTTQEARAAVVVVP